MSVATCFIIAFARLVERNVDTKDLRMMIGILAASCLVWMLLSAGIVKLLISFFVVAAYFTIVWHHVGLIASGIQILICLQIGSFSREQTTNPRVLCSLCSKFAASYRWISSELCSDHLCCMTFCWIWWSYYLVPVTAFIFYRFYQKSFPLSLRSCFASLTITQIRQETDDRYLLPRLRDVSVCLRCDFIHSLDRPHQHDLSLDL